MFRRLQVSLSRTFSRNSDLLALWGVLLVAQSYVPVTHFLGRADLVPWMMLTLSAAAFFRAQRFGAGPHPMLTPRIDRINALIQKAAAAVAPWALMYVYDAAVEADPKPLGFAGGVAVAVVALVAVGGTHGRTAWNPDRRVPIVAILGSAIAILGTVGAAGFAVRMLPSDRYVHAGARALILGMAFLTIGLMAARIQNHRQRKAAGRKDGKPYRQQVFPAFLAAFGPAFGLFVILVVVRSLSFEQAFVVSLLVVVWASVIWPKPNPIMVSCVLHEVEPTGGADPKPAQGQANPFDAPPEGALRFNPAKTKRTLVMHPWLVPVRSSRIAELDDPVRPLWDVPPPMITEHVLGEAAFQPDPLTKSDQWEVITLKLRGRDDTAKVSGGGGQSLRMVILRAFPAPGSSARARMTTYRWDQSVPETAVQVLDATREFATLRDGDILLLSAEGVAKAYEVEIGAPIYRVADAYTFRTPQLEDYVEL